MIERYAAAFTDWLACAYVGRDEPAAGSARDAGSELQDRVVGAGTAGHVLDFDDTYLPGLSHLSAPVAPAALVLGAALDASIGDVLAAYAAGFESMAAVARASHPALYERGWHPTAVCGVVGSATAAAHLLDLSEERVAAAVGIALLRAGGLRAAFGSDGKSLQVGMAAATGVTAARLAATGSSVPPDLVHAPAGFEEVYGGKWATPDPFRPAVAENWIKAYPCCLQAHSSIEAADRCRREGASLEAATVTVHPVSRRAAPYDDVVSGLQAKFSIPYLAALTWLNEPPTVSDFDSLDSEARLLARTITVATDPDLLESEAVITTKDGFSATIAAALGSPQRPMSDEQLSAKVRRLAGTRLDGAFDSPTEDAKVLLDAAGL